MKKIILSIILLSLSNLLYSQVGIATQNPLGVFHVDANKNDNSSTTPTVAQQSDDFVIKNNGNIGVGNVNPKVKLDLRAADNSNSALGIGTTSASASTAGAGAIKYDPVENTMSYSNELVWVLAKPSIITKAQVVAVNTNSNTFSNLAETDVNSWTESTDVTNSFEPTTGIFTAPHDGIYNISASFNFNSGTIGADTYTRLGFIRSTGETNYCVTPYALSGTAEAGDACSSSFYLLSGETLKIAIFHNLGTDKTLNTSGGYNNLTILEQ